ncbi:MAG: MFS transporter, partial [Vicinamibacteria bacterium]|nr:MFS transporter [Vicinamibacteria bacterium]
AANLQTTVLMLQVYELSRVHHGVGESAFATGLVGLAEAIPFLALTLLGGWVSDHMDRRLVSMISYLGLIIGGVWLVALNLAQPHSLWPYYAVQALAGVVRAFFRPASVALGSELLPIALYANGATWRSTLFHISTVAGPALGALLYASCGAATTYSVMVAFLILGLLGFFRVHPRPRRRASSESIWTSVTQGVRFVFSTQLLLAALSLDLFAVLFGGAVAMIPAFALDVLRVGPAWVGPLRAAPAIGAIAMGFWLARRGMFPKAGAVMLGCVALFGVSWIGFALSRSVWLSLALLAVGGALDNVSVVLRGTLVQVVTPQDKMGRVAAVNSFFIGSSNELGAFESGLAARVLGLVPSVVVGGLLTLVTVAVTAWRSPKLRKLEQI